MNCAEFNFHENASAYDLSEGYNLLYLQDSASRTTISVHIPALTGCDNAYSATFATNRRGGDKVTRLNLCFARGGIRLYNISYLSDGFNLSDDGAKIRGNNHLIGELVTSNRRIGFLSCVEMKTLLPRQPLAD